MKKLAQFTVFAFVIMSLSSCQVIEGIFKAGVWSGVIMVVLVLALIIWLISRLFGGGKG
ncbi:hypothetical protein ACL9RF_08265 [Sphingobacterium sp. Mn56C]|uniref:hypothetical protein n=1 Tax=Sphingobacterium sp. Mn56C TaxID=3395261 RepID=UPI003BD07525